MRIVGQPAYGFDIKQMQSFNAYMNKDDFASRLDQLLRMDHRLPKKNGGELNVAKAAAIMGIGQSTLQRMLAGNSELPSRSNAEQIMEFLGVTFGQLIGTEDLPGTTEQEIAEASEASVMADAKQVRMLASRLEPAEVREFIRPLVEHLGDAERLHLIGMIARSDREGA